MNTDKILALLICVILLSVSVMVLPIFASAVTSVPVIQEIDLPQNLDFTVNNICSKHAYFMQAAAAENGCFIVYSRHVNPSDHSDVDFEKVYIDIYGPDGIFWKELSFRSSLDCAVEIDNNTVKVYFFSSVLIYSLDTNEVHHYKIPEGLATNGGTYKQLRNKKFTKGNWEYSYKKGMNGYVGLVRCDGSQTQVLVEMPGTSSILWRIILPGTVSAIVMLAIIVCKKKVGRHRT